MGQDFKCFVNGQWVVGETVRKNINPSNLNDCLGTVHYATADMVEHSVAAAQIAQRNWAEAGIQQRANVLDGAGDRILSRRESIGETLAREEGKTLAEAVGETARAGQILKFFAGEAIRNSGMAVESVRPDIDVQVSREPIGVVAAITPWNFPVAIPAWKVAPALAYGNAVILKCSEHTPASACLLIKALHDAGLPPGVVTLLQGDGNIGETLVESNDVGAVSFTGSVQVGGRIAGYCASRGIRSQLEMGGKNPLVVLDDAVLDTAVTCALDGAFYSTGQRCTASSRLIVQKRIYESFVTALTERLKALNVGDALDPATRIGPLASKAQMEKVLRYVEIGRQEAGDPAAGGRELKRTPAGYFVEPTLFTETHNGMRINRAEIFGPVATVIPVDSFEQALEVSNDTDFGLSAGICTQSLKYATEFRKRSAAGMVMVNLPTAGVDYHVPFGGTKASSVGPREQGVQAREFYTQTKTAYIAS